MYFWEENKMSLIKGIHHVALRPTYAQFEKAKTFYLDLLGSRSCAGGATKNTPA